MNNSISERLDALERQLMRVAEIIEPRPPRGGSGECQTCMETLDRLLEGVKGRTAALSALPAVPHLDARDSVLDRSVVDDLSLVTAHFRRLLGEVDARSFDILAELMAMGTEIDRALERLPDPSDEDADERR